VEIVLSAAVGASQLRQRPADASQVVEILGRSCDAIFAMGSLVRRVLPLGEGVAIATGPQTLLKWKLC
jgi:hypothetical protein